MTSLKIWVHDYRDHDHQPTGPIISPWLESPTDLPRADYAGFRAHYMVWKTGLKSDLVGFFAYRNYLWDRAWCDIPVGGPGSANVQHAQNWRAAGSEAFNQYRSFLSHWDGEQIKKDLESCDILQSAPYHLSPGKTILQDFGSSGSAKDHQALEEVTTKYGFAAFATIKLYHWLFITRWEIFDRMMTELEPLRLELHDRCTGADSNNGNYKRRVMDYVVERLYPLWLLKSGLNFKEVIELRNGAY